MDKNASEFTVLRTYKSIWKYERKIYSLENIKLLVPVRPSEVLFFGVGLLITYFLCKMVPFLHSVPFIFRYVLIPFGIMKFLTKKRLDGKMPHRFLIGYFIPCYAERNRTIPAGKKAKGDCFYTGDIQTTDNRKYYRTGIVRKGK